MATPLERAAVAGTERHEVAETQEGCETFFEDTTSGCSVAFAS
jgi:hypothetical protein